MRELKEENERLKTMADPSVSREAMADLDAKKKEIEDIKAALAESQKTFEQKLKDNASLEQKLLMKRRSSMLMSSTPVLVNLNEDKGVIGRIKYALPDDAVTTIGSHNMHATSDSEEDTDGDDNDDASDADSDDDSDDDGPEVILMSESV